MKADNRCRKGAMQADRVRWLASRRDLLDQYPRPLRLIRKSAVKISWLDDVIFNELKQAGLYGAGTHQGDCNIVELVRLARLALGEPTWSAWHPAMPKANIGLRYQR